MSCHVALDRHPFGRGQVNRSGGHQQARIPARKIDHRQQPAFSLHMHHTAQRSPSGRQAPAPSANWLRNGLSHASKRCRRCRTLGSSRHQRIRPKQNRRARAGKRQRTIDFGAVEGQAVIAAQGMDDHQFIAAQHLHRMAVDHPGIGQVRIAAMPARPALARLGSPRLAGASPHRPKTPASPDATSAVPLCSVPFSCLSIGPASSPSQAIPSQHWASGKATRIAVVSEQEVA